MPIKSVKLIPGVNVEKTPTLNEAGISQSSFGRFRDGLFQKIGGWAQYFFYNAGIPRALHAWQDLNSLGHLAVGTTSSFGVITSGAVNVLTPQQVTTNPAVNFSTIISTKAVTIIDASLTGVTTIYDGVYFNTPISVGGLILSGFYSIVVPIASATSYTITAAKNATSTVNNGGAVPTFKTTSGSAVVEVGLIAHGLANNDTINFPIATTANGITIVGSYVATVASDADKFTITGNAQATADSTVSMNGAAAQLLYTITAGPASAGAAYGTGTFGSGTYGFGITPGTQTGTPISATNWTIDNWGQDVVACPAGGGIYYWNPTGGFTTLVNILTAPVFNEGIFVSMPQQILVAYGSTVAQNIGVQQDPLLVAWSDIGDFEAWTPLTTNQAGSYRIPTGSKIVGGIQGPQNGLIWTDLDMWSMNYLGYPLVFGFTKVGANCGLAGKHAACQLGGNVYWMGQSNFFMFGGSGVQVIPCPIWDYVFQNVDTANIYKTVACANTSFNEVWWFFPASAGSGEPNRYVKYNTLERTWDYGVLSRTAWIDQSVLGPPIAASPDSYIWQHETTEDAAGSAIVSSMQTGYFVVNEAHEKTFIDLIWPDFKYGLYGGSQGASIQVTVYGADYPTDTPTAFGPFTMNSTTQYINLRMRARLVAMKFESSDLGSFWRIGNVRVRYAQDGKV